MERFKLTIKRRIILLSVGVLVAAVLCLNGFFAKGNPTMVNGNVRGFQLGLIFGLGVRALIEIINMSIVIKDDKKLRMLYNKENDERLKLIRSKSGMPMLMFTSILMLVAAIISGYFNAVIFSTLAIAASAQLLIGVIAKLYYMKTM